jgi:aspartyl/glutamyl-tRNA(Asn/Gln) amidotransferase C subunit
LSYVDQLQEVNIENKKSNSNLSEIKNIVRNDEVKDWKREELELALSQAIKIVDGQVKVPRVLE